MKIVPAEQPPIRGSLLSPEPRVPFSDLLGAAFATPPSGDRLSLTGLPGGDGAEGTSVPTSPLVAPNTADPDMESRVAAATFQAFGMFGRRAEVASVESQAALPPAATSALAEQGALESASAVQAAAAQGGVHVSLPNGAGVESRVRPATYAVSRQPGHGGDPASGEAPVVRELLTPQKDEVPAGGIRRKAMSRAVGNEDSARLTLSDGTDAAGLAVRLANLSPEEIAQFRARARDLLGEHGLSLETLSINGEDRSESDLPVREIKQWR